jgi:hypothetical protein
VIKKAQVLRDSHSQEERAVGRVSVLIVSCLCVAASLTPAWAAALSETQQGDDYVQGAPSQRYHLLLGEEPDSSFSMDLKGLGLAQLQAFSSTFLHETIPALQGMKARHEIDLGNHSFEFSGGLVPGMKSLVPSESHLNSSARLGYVNLTILLSQFYLKGGAFFGQNIEALGLDFKRPSEVQNAKRDIFGYLVSGGYRFSDSLSMQAGWGQATQEYEITKESLAAWYLQAHISLGWRMSVTPQTGFIGITTSDGEKIREEAFYYGARWQINF